MRLVALESPYAANEKYSVNAHVEYARVCLRDSIDRGEAPIASHLLYTQPGVLKDNDLVERAIGMEAGAQWALHAEATVLYCDLGISAGMMWALERAKREGRLVEYRRILPQDAGLD